MAGSILRGPRPDFLPGADIAPRKVNWHNRSQVRQLHDGMIDGDVGRSEIGLAVEAQEIPVLFRSEEHTSELQSLMRISYAVFCLKKKKIKSTLDLMIYLQTTLH